MPTTDLLTSIQYVVDEAGHKKAVQVDIDAWNQIVALLAEAERLQQEHLTTEFEAWDALSDEALIDLESSLE